MHNKLFVPSEVSQLKQYNHKFSKFSDVEEALTKFLTLNVNVSKQHDRVSLLSTLLKKASSCRNFNINSITATGQSLLHLACNSGSIISEGIRGVWY